MAHNDLYDERLHGPGGCSRSSFGSHYLALRHQVSQSHFSDPLVERSHTLPVVLPDSPAWPTWPLGTQVSTRTGSPPIPTVRNTIFQQGTSRKPLLGCPATNLQFQAFHNLVTCKTLLRHNRIFLQLATAASALMATHHLKPRRLADDGCISPLRTPYICTSAFWQPCHAPRFQGPCLRIKLLRL